MEAVPYLVVIIALLSASSVQHQQKRRLQYLLRYSLRQFTAIAKMPSCAHDISQDAMAVLARLLARESEDA